MDGQKTGTAVNGAKKASDSQKTENEAKEKVNKTLLLRQQIEENRLRMQQREKEISNSKKNLEQLFTQLDRSASGMSLNMSTDVEDVRDSKIASLESSLAALKSEKRELELKLLSLETVQEAKECLEIEISDLRSSQEHLMAENQMLQLRTQQYHALEDENDELKLKLDRLAYENSSLKEDLGARDETIQSYEAKISKLQMDFEDISAKSAAAKETSTTIKQLEQQLDQLSKERNTLHSECESLQKRLSEVITSAPVVASPEVKVSSLGAKKKPKPKRGKGEPVANDEVKTEDTSALESQIALLTTQRDALESDNVSLKSSIANLEEKLTETDTERRTLQQRVELLMAELSTETEAYNNTNDLANLQMLVQEKETAYTALAGQLEVLVEEKEAMVQQLENADKELFELRAKCRDVEYTIKNKEDTIRELQERLSAQPEPSPPVVEQPPVDIVPQPAIKISNIGAGKKSRSRGRGGRTVSEAKPPPSQEESGHTQSLEQISTLNSKIAALEQEIASLNEKNARLATAEEQFTTLQEQLATSEQEKRTLQKRVDLLLTELDSNDGRDEINSLQQLLQAKGEECAQLLFKLEGESDKSEVQQRLNEAEGELFELRAQQRDTQYVLNSKEEQIGLLQQKLEATCGQIEQLKEVVAELESKLLEQEAFQADEEKSASNAVSHLQEALREARQELANMENELTNRSEALQRLEKSCATLTKETSEKNVEILRLKEDLQDAEVVLAEKDAKLKMVQDELNQMKIRADDDSSMSTWETQLNHSQMEREIMRNDLDTRSAQLNECKEFCCKLESQLEEAKATESRLVAASETANAQRVAAEEKLGQLSDKFKKLAANYKQKLQVIQQLEAKMAKVKEAASQGGEPQQLQLRLAETETEIKQLQDQLAKMQETASQLTQTRQTLADKEDELLEEKENHQQMVEENKKLLEQLEQLRSTADELEQTRRTLVETESRLHSTEEEAQQTKEENRKLGERLQELEDAMRIVEQLQTALRQAQHDTAALQEQFDVSQSNVSRLSEENGSLLEQVARAGESAGVADQLIHFQEEVKRLASELESTRSQLLLATEQNSQLFHQLQQTADPLAHLEQLKMALSRAESELAVSRNQLDEVQQEARQTSEESRKLMEQLTEATDRVYQLQSQLEQQQNESRVHLEEADRRIWNMTQEHSSTMKSLQDELVAVRDQLKSICDGQQDEESIRNQLEERLRTSENDAAQLRTELNDLSQLRDRLLQETGELRARAEQLQSDLASSAEAASVMQTQLADLWEEKQQALNRNVQFEEELTYFKHQQEERSSAADMERELAGLRDQLAAAQWDLETKTSELSSVHQLRDQLSAAQWELDSKSGQLADLEQQRQSDSEKIVQLEKRCAELDAWIETNTGDVPALRLRIQELENQLADLNNQYSGLYSTYGTKLFEMTTLENQLADANLKVTQLTDESARHQESVDQWTSRISSLEQETLTTVTALRDQLADLEATNTDLLAQVAQLREELSRADDVRNRMDQLTQELDTLRSTGEEQSRLISEKDSNLEHTQSQLDSLVSERNGLLDDINRRDLDLEQMKRQLSDMEEQVRQSQASAINVQEIGLLRMNLADLTSERDDLQYQMEDVQAQCSTLETKITEAEEVRSILETTVSYLESKVSELQSELAVLSAGREEDQNAHSAQLAALTEERDALSANLNSVQQQNQELVSLRLTLDEAERMLKESDAALVAARLGQTEAIARTEESERQLADALRCLSEEQQKCRNIIDQREELEQKLNQAHQAGREERVKLLEQIDQLQQELDRLQTVSELCDQYKAEVEEARRIQSQVDDWKNQAEEVSQLRVKLFEALSEKDELESSVQTLEEELAAVQAQLEHRHRQSSTELDDLQRELEDTRIASGQLVVIQEELEQTRLELEAANKRNAAELASLQSQLDTERSTGQATAFELNARCADMDMERSLLMAKCMELQDVQAALEAKCAELEQLRSELVLEKERLESELADRSNQPVAQPPPQSTESTSSSELAQLRLAVMDLTTEKEELEEKLAEAEEKLGELSSLRITNSELSMELEEAQARIQVAEEERESQVADIKRQLAESVAKLSQQEERIDRVSVERDQLQQAVSRMSEVHVRSEKSELEGQEKTEPLNVEGGDVAALRKQIASLETELHDAKIKAAKSLRQVKLLRAELAKEKEAAAVASKPSGGDDYFNFAVEEELRKQVSDAEKVTAEKVKEIERLLSRIDTLEGASERFMQAKERQDTEMAMLQQRNRELLSQIASLEWDSSETGTNVKERVPDATEPQPQPIAQVSDDHIAALETTISQLTDDNENYQDMLDELKSERQAIEAQLKERIAALEQDVADKTRLLDQVSQQVENKDRLLSDAYDSVSQLRQQVKQLAEAGSGESGGLLEDLRRENENLVDMIRQLSTTGTLDAATIERLKLEIDQSGGVVDDRFQQSSDLGDGSIDWQSGFNDLQIEVEYLRSQNATLLSRLQEAGLVWDDGTELVSEDNDRIELLRLQLDDAIRNVHERDMRCQELTWEITKLLEERDTLQLRLSNSLRQNHEMQQELKDFTATASGASPMGDLATKLRELKQLNYSLDVQLRREQEERQTIERQLMALYGTRGGSTSPIYANGARRLASRQQDSDGAEIDMNHSQEFSSSGQVVLSEWLKGKESSDVQHI